MCTNAELVYQNAELVYRSAELAYRNAELAYQNAGLAYRNARLALGVVPSVRESCACVRELSVRVRKRGGDQSSGSSVTSSVCAADAPLDDLTLGRGVRR